MKRLILFIASSLIALSVSGQSNTVWWRWVQNRGFTTPALYLAAGATGEGTTSVTPAFSAAPAPADGNMLIMVVGTKLQTAVVSNPTGWKCWGEFIASTASNGSDVGPIKQTVFYKEADGTESGTESVTITGGNSAFAYIYSFSKNARAKWDIEAVPGHHNTVASTAYLARSNLEIHSKKNDIYLVSSFINTDAFTYSEQALAQTGITFETLNAELTDAGTIQGNDQGHVASTYKVTSGSATGHLTYTMTASSSTASAPRGITFFIRLRQSTSTQTTPPSRVHRWRAADATSSTYSGDGSHIWDGMRTSLQGTGSGFAERYSIETHNGRPCYKFQTELLNSSNYSMRAEVSQPVVWQPVWVIGTTIIHEIKYETPADAPDVYSEFDVLQNHTGTAPGGPWPLNSPIYYFAFAHAGQTGWTNTGSAAVGGEFMVVLKTAGPDVRHLVTGFDWAPGTSYCIRHAVRFDYASGDPALVVWLSINGGPYTLVYENYTDKTVWEDADIATDGAPADVGGSMKVGIYDHAITSGTAASNAITAGHTGYILYSPAANMIIQHPTDVDYISDITNISDYYLDAVSTLNE